MPGLSEKAQLAVDAVFMAGARPGWTRQPHFDPRAPSVDIIARAVRVAPIWAGIKSDATLYGELVRFKDAVDGRLPNAGYKMPDRSENPASTALRVWHILDAAHGLHFYHPFFQAYVTAEPERRAQAARAAEQERARHLAAERAAAEQTRKLEAQQAETERKFREWLRWTPSV